MQSSKFYLRNLRGVVWLCLYSSVTAWAGNPVLAPKVAEAETETVVLEKVQGFHRPVWFGFWNMRWFPGYHPFKQNEATREKQTRAAAGLIRKWKPSVLFASEVRSVEALKKLDLDYPYLACTDIVRTEDEGRHLPQQGIAVMSRVAWEKIWVLDFSELPQTSDRPSRGILGVQFKMADGEILTCYAVHLKSNRGGIKATHIRRERAIDYLIWDWKRLDLDPARDAIVVMGDFNTSADDPAFKRDRTLSLLEAEGFRDSAQGVIREKRLTIPGGRYPANDFDHILISMAASKRLEGEPEVKQEVRKVPGEVSDHNAVFLNVSRWFEPEL